MPANLVFAEKYGLYLHIGIDPAETPTFATKSGKDTKRGVATSEELLHKINNGSGGPLPFVKLTDKYSSLDDLEHITPADIAKIEQRVAKVIRRIDMDKLRTHLQKETRATRKKAAAQLAQGDAAVVAEEAAKVNVKATAKAAANENVEATAEAAAEKDAEKTARISLKRLGLSDEAIEAAIKQSGKK